MNLFSIKWEWKKLINEKFFDLPLCKDRFLILYGGRGSSKSDYAAKHLIYNCLTHKYFKCILYRRTYETIKDSSYETIKSIIEAMKLESLFEFRVSPLSITCKNGNKFIARGGDKPKSLKSIKDPTCIWYEEEIPNEHDFAVMSMTLRSQKADYLQEIFSLNPDIDEEYENNWFWIKFFKGQTELSFDRKSKIKIDGENVEVNAKIHHSTYLDNAFLTPAYKALIESYKDTNDYLYSLYAKGLWTKRQRGGNFYKTFIRSVHVKSVKYNPENPLHISFDFNVLPYMTLVIWQKIEGKKMAQIDEICLGYPQNTTKAVCAEFERKYYNHEAGLFIYGDPAGKAESTREDGVIRQGYNEYTMILNELARYKPELRLLAKAPQVIMRGKFINSIFEHNFAQIELFIDENCKNSIADYEYLKEDSEGKKLKKKVKDRESDASYEEYGHTSDASDYFICYYFRNELHQYQFGTVKNDITLGKFIKQNRF